MIVHYIIQTIFQHTTTDLLQKKKNRNFLSYSCVPRLCNKKIVLVETLAVERKLADGFEKKIIKNIQNVF